MKPDGVERGLAGEVVSRLERKKLRLVAAELRTITKVVAETHYAEHAERPFFGDLVAFITRSPALIMVVEGPKDTYAVVRLMMGTTNPAEAAPGHHPRRFGDRDDREPRARFRLARVGGAGDRTVLPGPGDLLARRPAPASAGCNRRPDRRSRRPPCGPHRSPIACGRITRAPVPPGIPSGISRESSNYGRKSPFPAWS